MRIKFLNLCNPIKVTHSILLIKGRIENYSQEVWRKCFEKSFMMVYHQGPQEYRRCEEIALEKLQFKFLVRLHAGDNTLSFDFLGVKDTINISYEPIQSDYGVCLVYVVCSGHDGKFQGPDYEDCGVFSAKARISLGGELLQCIMAETLWESGLGRKTFKLEMDDSAGVKVHVLESSLSVEECWAMSGEELWETIAREIMFSTLKDEKSKYLAFISCTRYTNRAGIKPSSYSQVLRMTKGHVALGGGGLALFGTGALWTWPTHLSQVQKRLLCDEAIDTNLFMDDSAYRGTIGGTFATTLGSALHELGHCFDLGHTGDGIMARGFDDLDLFFTLLERNLTSKEARSLDPCSSYQREDLSPLSIGRSNSFNSSEGSPRFTSVRRSDSISKYLEDYAQKRLRYQNKISSGCFWTSSCALLLSKQKWMNKSECSLSQFQLPDVDMSVCCDLSVIEVRGDGGKVLQYWTEESTCLDLKAMVHGNRGATSLVLITNCGRAFKKSLNENNQE